MKKLENIEKLVIGNWYEPVKVLSNYKSVVKVEYLESSSSAGDWSGYFIQKIGNKYYFILFNQENNYPDLSFTLATGNVKAVANNLNNEDAIVQQIVDECY